MKKYLGIILGSILILFIFYLQFSIDFRKNKLKSVNLIGSKITFQNIKPLKDNGFKLDSSSVRLIIFASAECDECDALINALNTKNKENQFKDVILVIPSTQASLASKYHDMTLPLYKIEVDEVIRKIKFVPTFLYLDKNNIIIRFNQGGVDTLDKMFK